MRSSCLLVMLLLAGCSEGAQAPQEHPRPTPVPTAPAPGQKTIPNWPEAAKPKTSIEQLARSKSKLVKDFEALKQAIQKHDGQAAADLAAQSTIQLYEMNRKLALDSSSVDFETIDPFSIAMTFTLRYLLPKALLEQMSGRDVYIWSIENKIAQNNRFSEFTIYKAKYEGNIAFVTMARNGKVVTGSVFKFVREDEHWKVDMIFLIHQANQLLDKLRKDGQKSRVELAIELLEKTYQQKIPAEILNGPLK